MASITQNSINDALESNVIMTDNNEQIDSTQESNIAEKKDSGEFEELFEEAWDDIEAEESNNNTSTINSNNDDDGDEAEEPNEDTVTVDSKNNDNGDEIEALCLEEFDKLEAEESNEVIIEPTATATEISKTHSGLTLPNSKLLVPTAAKSPQNQTQSVGLTLPPRGSGSSTLSQESTAAKSPQKQTQSVGLTLPPRGSGSSTLSQDSNTTKSTQNQNQSVGLTLPPRGTSTASPPQATSKTAQDTIHASGRTLPNRAPVVNPQPQAASQNTQNPIQSSGLTVPTRPSNVTAATQVQVEGVQNNNNNVSITGSISMSVDQSQYLVMQNSQNTTPLNIPPMATVPNNIRPQYQPRQNFQNAPTAYNITAPLVTTPHPMQNLQNATPYNNMQAPAVIMPQYQRTQNLQNAQTTFNMPFPMMNSAHTGFLGIPPAFNNMHNAPRPQAPAPRESASRRQRTQQRVNNQPAARVINNKRPAPSSRGHPSESSRTAAPIDLTGEVDDIAIISQPLNFSSQRGFPSQPSPRNQIDLTNIGEGRPAKRQRTHTTHSIVPPPSGQRPQCQFDHLIRALPAENLACHCQRVINGVVKDCKLRYKMAAIGQPNFQPPVPLGF